MGIKDSLELSFIVYFDSFLLEYKCISHETVNQSIKVPRETLHMKQIHKKGKKNQVGAWGEEITIKYLRKRGFSILNTNYLKKWGEIDIVARETLDERQGEELIRFVEVKTVSYKTRAELDYAVTLETWRPEEQVTEFKLRKLNRVIESWLLENNFESDWQIDIAAVRIVPQETYATIKYIDNIF